MAILLPHFDMLNKGLYNDENSDKTTALNDVNRSVRTKGIWSQLL